MKFLLTILIALAFNSCAPIYNVNVDSISSPTAKQKNRYILLPGNESSDETDLQFMEFATYTEKALHDSGFVKADCIEEADVAIYLHYGISDPLVSHYTYSLPVWGQTGVSASTTSGVVTRCGRSAIYSNQTTYTPNYGVVGSTTHVGTLISFARHFALLGVDIKKSEKNQNAVQLWSTKVNSVGESGDLRRVFPVLLGASQKYIATNTGGNITITLREDDAEVLRVKGLLEETEY